MFKKMICALVAGIFVSILLNPIITNAQEENKYNSDYYGKGEDGFDVSQEEVEAIVNSLIEEENRDNIYQPMYITYEVNKPIKYTGVLHSAGLKRVIEHYENRKSLSEAFNSLTGLVNAQQVVSDTFTAFMQIGGYRLNSLTGIERMKQAYWTGQSYWYAGLYASGVKPSLSIEVRGVYSKAQVMFRYVK